MYVHAKTIVYITHNYKSLGSKGGSAITEFHSFTPLMTIQLTHTHSKIHVHTCYSIILYMYVYIHVHAHVHYMCVLLIVYIMPSNLVHRNSHIIHIIACTYMWLSCSYTHEGCALIAKDSTCVSKRTPAIRHIYMYTYTCTYNVHVYTPVLY